MGQITEILGFTSTERDEVYIRIWENKLNRPVAYKDVLTISQSTLSMGGGSNAVRKVSGLFVTEQAKQVYMSHDKEGRGKQPYSIAHTYPPNSSSNLYAKAPAASQTPSMLASSS